MTARSWVETALRETTPAQPFRQVVSARFEGSGGLKIAVGTLEMFDGQEAVVEVGQQVYGGWCYRWLRLDGGGFCWRDGAWRRLLEVTP